MTGRTAHHEPSTAEDRAFTLIELLVVWHRTYNTAGPWTNAGGAAPEGWPAWMRSLRDY